MNNGKIRPVSNQDSQNLESGNGDTARGLQERLESQYFLETKRTNMPCKL
jgi:hypothetical protein